MNETLEVVVNAELAGAGFDLVELRTAGSRGQPLFEIRIERRDGVGVTVGDCARISRLLEARLVAVDGDDAVAVVTLEQNGRRRDVPLAKVKEARLAFRI